MDVQRGIIFVGLAIVSYLMILAWNEDYGQIVPSQSITQTQSSSTNNSNDQFDIPAKNFTKTRLEDEFTTPEQLNKEPALINSETTQQSINSYVKISTDVLNITINLTGGNIVESLLKDYKLNQKTDQLLPILESSNKRLYVAESGLYGKDGFDSAKNGPVPIYSVTQTSYSLKDSEKKLSVNLLYKGKNGVNIIKRYTFERNKYLIDVKYIIKNTSDKPFTANFSAKLKRDESPDPSQQSSMGMKAFLGMVLSTPNEPYTKYSFGDLKDKNLNENVRGGWISLLQHYFLSAWIPDKDTVHTYQSRYKNGNFLIGFTSPAITVQAGEEKQVGAKLYSGPKILDRLEAAAPKLDKTVDYGMLFFIAYPLFRILEFLHSIVGNWGVSIILVTLLVKLAFFQLSAKSYRSMANMRRVGPKLQQLKEQHGDDRQKMSQAMMELYKKEKINPLGGCLPVLVQMPVFISLYWVLMESVQLRQSPFFFWITDLAVKDPYFILPIIMGASMFVQMQLNPTPPDPMQAKVMKIMPVMFSVFFLWFPAGLVLYWVVNNILSITQQWIITKKIEGDAEPAH